MEFFKSESSYPPRPGTSGGSSRPSTASGIRPGTSSGGRRHLTSSSVATASLTVPAPDLSIGNHSSNNNLLNKETINREAEKDDLLRILNQSKNQIENEALLKAEQGDSEAIRALIQNGLDLMCQGYQGYSLLHHAANRGHCKVIAELLRHRVIPIDVQNDAGETPLHLAAYNGHLLAVDQLLDHGANINALNNDHETCLFYAARKSTPVIVRLLIQRGVDANIRDKYDEIAIDHASNPLVAKAFQCSNNNIAKNKSGINSKFSYDNLMRIFSYLEVNDILRAACVCSKWHRVSENDSIWKALGVRRWELALQSSLGFAPTTTSSFLSRPKSRTGSSSSISRSNSNRVSRSNSFTNTPSFG